VRPKLEEGLVITIIRNAAAGVAAALAMAAPGSAALAEDFPLIGTYMQNVPCKGDGSDPAALRVKITAQEIDSNVGVCSILDTKKDGDSLLAHVECKLNGGPMVGDITFTPRPDKTIEFVDRDVTYKAILHRCPD